MTTEVPVVAGVVEVVVLETELALCEAFPELGAVCAVEGVLAVEEGTAGAEVVVEGVVVGVAVLVEAMVVVAGLGY